MRIIFRLWIVVLCVSLFGCVAGEESSNNFGSGSLRGAGEESSSQRVATIRLSPDRGGPNTAVSLTGGGFPVDAAVNFFLSTADSVANPLPYGQGVVNGLGELDLTLMMPTIWSEGDLDEPVQLLLEVRSADQSVSAFSTFILSVENALEPFYFQEGDFTLMLPATWEATAAQQTSLGAMFTVGIPPIEPGNPANSLILVADANAISAVGAADLLCGSGCKGDVRLRRIALAEEEARVMLIQSDGAPALEWYFIEHADKLIYFTLHDPVTLLSLEPLINTISFDTVPADEVAAAEVMTELEATAQKLTQTPTKVPAEIVSATPTATLSPEPSPTATLKPTPTPNLDVDPDAGPIEVATDFLHDILSEEPINRTFNSLGEGIRPEDQRLPKLLALLEIERIYTTFELARLESSQVVVLVKLGFDDDSFEERTFTFTHENDAWRIHSIERVETAAEEETERGEVTELTGTPQPSETQEQENEEGTPSPEASTPETAATGTPSDEGDSG